MFGGDRAVQQSPEQDELLAVIIRNTDIFDIFVQALLRHTSSLSIDSS